MRTLEMGGGENPKYCRKYGNGLNIDNRELPTVDVIADFEKPLPIESRTYDHIYSAYAIEHLSWRNVEAFIAELHRILAINGTVEIVTANTMEQCRKILLKGEWDQDSSCMLFGGQENVSGAHRCGFSAYYISRLFLKAGFMNIRVANHPACPTDMILTADRNDGRVAWILSKMVKGESILNVGCNSGTVFQDSEFEDQLTNLDMDVYDLPNFHKLDAHKLISEAESGFKDKQFDTAVLGEILEHSP